MVSWDASAETIGKHWSRQEPQTTAFRTTGDGRYPNELQVSCWTSATGMRWIDAMCGNTSREDIRQEPIVIRRRIYYWSVAFSGCCYRRSSRWSKCSAGCPDIAWSGSVGSDEGWKLRWRLLETYQKLHYNQNIIYCRFVLRKAFGFEVVCVSVSSSSSAVYV